jgi:hypothetical protein
MLFKLLLVIALVAIGQILLVWVLVHLGIALLGAFGWWSWSAWHGRSRA